MKFLFFIILSFSYILAFNCNDILNQKIDLSDQSIVDKIDNCKESLKNVIFTKDLYKISNEIRGSNSSCSGISYLPKLTEFNLLLLKISLDPLNYQKELQKKIDLDKKYQALNIYFKYWAYQSIGNFRLYQSFWQKYNDGLKPLEDYYQKTFNLNKEMANFLAKQALNEFLNWAVGETRIIKKISKISQILENKNCDEICLKDFIYANNPTKSELTIALRSALLNQRDITIIQTLLNFGADLNEGYESAIFYALENYQNTKFLIEQGANVNQGNAFGKTPLFYAIEFQKKDIIELLLNNKADVNHKYINNNEKLALSANIESNTPYFITFCALDHTSKNVLMHAAAYANVEILKLLVQKGAKLFEKDDLGFNALDFALAAKKEENAKYLQSLGLKPNENLFYGGSLE
ncbi:ankyrin repeat domain-containing protein [Campylobacter sp. TTU_617]|uniref:ankyrin repeat domain-containing protein n=1 Tax=Campylobacter sp. TTU_617 TaxID=2768148 RepID=UPI00190336B0|nr:ankyrin repeat domain-containing protein [Campylobacter sp. TTU_617]